MCTTYHTQCTACNTKKCTACAKGYYLKNGTCHPCTDHDANCVECNASDCTLCKTNYKVKNGKCEKTCVNKTYYECDGEKCYSNSIPSCDDTRWTCKVKNGTSYTIYNKTSCGASNPCHCGATCNTGSGKVTCKSPSGGCTKFYFENGCSKQKRCSCGGDKYKTCSTEAKTECVEE